MYDTQPINKKANFNMKSG